jgi:peptide/nickel transport system ATP-binding protein
MSAPLLTATGLRVHHVGAHGRRAIVNAIDLHVSPGETIGILGESGSGKSLSARAIIGLLPSGVVASGRVEYEGQDLLSLKERALRRIRGREVGLVMQDPFTMLNPLLRCGVQVTEGLLDDKGRRLGQQQRRAEAVRRLAEVGIKDESVADRYPFELSGGMRQRVGIAAALARDPKLLIADEPSTALDVTTQREILALLKSLQESRGMGLILITHDLRVASEVCERIYVLYAGSVLEAAPAEALDREPRHPYTLGLLRSEPPADRRLATLPVIGGSVPRADDVAGQCPFAARCQWALDACRAGHPALRPLEDGTRRSACIRAEEIRAEMREARRATDVAAVGEAERAAGSALVTVRDLVKVYRRGDQETAALRGVSLEIGENEAVGLVGESGSGKTTLGRCLIGLERPTSGTIEIAGIAAHDYGAVTPRDRAALRRTVQIVFQDPYSSLNPVRTIGATLEEAVLAHDGRARKVEREVAQLLARVGLPADYAQRKPAALSGGERQRVAIARALAIRPRLIVCDEPVSALDVSVQAQIINLLTSLRDELGVSYLFITHDLAVVRQAVERVYVLLRGEVVEAGEAGAVLDRPQHDYTKLLVASVPGGRAPDPHALGGAP